MKLLCVLPILLSSLLASGQTPKPRGDQARTQGRLLVFLDPGHGGEDLGAHGAQGLLEKAAALELAQALGAQLAAAGMEVRFTRSGDVFVPLWDRARLANEAGADLFVSLHLNASRARQAKGSEVYFLSLGAGDQGAAELAAEENAGGAPEAASSPESLVAGILEDLSQKAYLQDSERLAVAIQARLNTLSGIKERGVKQAPFVVLRGAAMPAVLVETAFISNPREEARLRNPAFRLKVAQAITQGIRRFFADGAATSRRRTVAASR